LAQAILAQATATAGRAAPRPAQPPMGVSKCSQFCERGISSSIPGSGAPWPRPPAPPSATAGVGKLTALSYTPPPPADSQDGLEELLGMALPTLPPVRAAGTLPSPQVPASSSSTSRRHTGRSSGRPGEPVNKVYVQFSCDLMGFLPYTLVISEEQGLEFASLSESPDFMLDPLHILGAERVGYNELFQDAFFRSLSRSIHSRQEATRQAGTAHRSNEERARPPYQSVVQLSLRRTAFEGGQVLVFIAVQSEMLADELLNSCRRLRKLRAIQSRDAAGGADAAGAGSINQPGGSQAPEFLPSRSPPAALEPQVLAGPDVAQPRGKPEEPAASAAGP